MTVNIAPSPRQQFFDVNGDPLTGGKLFTYAAGTTTKQSTYTSSTGLTANSNPIVLDSNGRSPYGIWLSGGVSYKFVLAPSTDSDPPVSAIFTEDNVLGVNDSTEVGFSDWISDDTLTPTYISATSFSFSGDQRSAYHVGRRIRAHVTAGTVYGQIISSAYAAPTNTITVVLDGGSLDSGLSAVDVGLLSQDFPSLPLDQSVPLVNGYVSWTIAANALTVTIKTLTGNNPSATEPVYCVFRDVSQASAPLVMRSITSALSMTVSSGSTLGTISGEASRIRCVAIDTGSGVVLGVYNSWYDTTKILTPLDESKLYSPTAEGGAGAADTGTIIYATAAHTTKPILEIGYMESTQTTAGTWAQAIDKQVTVSATYKRSGQILSTQSKRTGEVVTGTTVMVLDDTIPQDSEGIAVFSAIGFVPRSAANLLQIRGLLNMSSSVSTGTLMATLNTAASAPDCVASAAVRAATATALYELTVLHSMIANSTSSIELELRGGCTSAGTTTFNGTGGGRLLGGVLYSSLEITEIFL